MTLTLGRLLSGGRTRPALSARGQRRGPVTSFLVVTAGPSPSFDYYLGPRMDASGLPVKTVRLTDAPPLSLSADTNGTMVIFCRYVTAAWVAALADARIAGAALFLDDDIAALIDDATAPLPYRLRLWNKHQRHVPALSRALDLLWVSTPALAARFPRAQPTVLHPLADAADTPLQPHLDRPRRIAFHSTASHAAEHAWLAPVLRRIAETHSDVTFDIYVNWRTARYWRDIPRVAAHAPEAWPVYRQGTRQRSADLLLAPMLPSTVNAARAPTKRIDAYRMGAALLTNAADVYAPDGEERAAGMLVPLDQDSWFKAITALIEDPGRLAALSIANAHVVTSWQRHATDGLLLR